MNSASKAYGPLAFGVGSVRGLLKYTDSPVTVRFDGGESEQMTITAFAVANGQYFGGGMKVAPDADPYDGKFAVTVWSGFGASDFIFKQRMLRDGRHVELPGTKVRVCTTVEASSEKEVLIDCDGEQPGKLPCKMRVLPGAIRLAV